MKKFNTNFYVNGEFFGFAECTIEGAKEYMAQRPFITSCEGFAIDEWFTYTIEKGWEHFYETDTDDGEIPDDCWDEVGYNPYIGGFDMDC